MIETSSNSSGVYCICEPLLDRRPAAEGCLKSQNKPLLSLAPSKQTSCSCCSIVNAPLCSVGAK
jgi:hypothetical protein